MPAPTGMHPAIAKAMSEAEWQVIVMNLLRHCGWRRVHIGNVNAGQRRGWTVPYVGDGGLPDIIAARDGRVLLVELKRVGGKPTLDQKAWLTAAGIDGHCWTPADLAIVQAVLA